MNVGGSKFDMFHLAYEVILYEWIPKSCNKKKKHLMNQTHWIHTPNNNYRQIDKMLI